MPVYTNGRTVHDTLYINLLTSATKKGRKGAGVHGLQKGKPCAKPLAQPKRYHTPLLGDPISARIRRAGCTETTPQGSRTSAVHALYYLHGGRMRVLCVRHRHGPHCNCAGVAIRFSYVHTQLQPSPGGPASTLRSRYTAAEVRPSASGLTPTPAAPAAAAAPRPPPCT